MTIDEIIGWSNYQPIISSIVIRRCRQTRIAPNYLNDRRCRAHAGAGPPAPATAAGHAGMDAQQYRQSPPSVGRRQPIISTRDNPRVLPAATGLFWLLKFPCTTRNSPFCA